MLAGALGGGLPQAGAERVDHDSELLGLHLERAGEGDLVASRFALTGSNRGRRLRLAGITLSRLRDGRIVEDRSGFDSLELFRQLGLRRTLLGAPRLLRALRDHAG